MKLINLTSCPTSGAGSVALGAEKPKSPSSVYSAAPGAMGPPTNDFGTKSIPVTDESAASSANGDVIGCGGPASTSRTGTSSARICARLAAVHLFGPDGSKTQRSSLGPPTGLNTA